LCFILDEIIMPLPKIAGLLNNCALNSGLPTLLDVIQEIGEAEACGNLDKFADSPIFQKYRMLKSIFAAYYRISCNEFNWVVFSRYLNEHSFLANEIIFAPILRIFIAQIAIFGGKYFDPLMEVDDVAGLCELQDAVQGRYYNLEFVEAAELFYHQFGISMRISQVHGETTVPTGELIANEKIDYPFRDGARPSVTLYLSGGETEGNGHFEIQPPGDELNEASRLFNVEMNGLSPALNKIFEGLTSSMTAAESRSCLDSQLLPYVQDGLGRLMADIANQVPNAPRSYNPSNFIVSSKDYLMHRAGEHEYSREGLQTMVLILLGILYDNGESNAQTLIEAITYLSDLPTPTSKQILDRLLSNIIRSGANLTNEKVQESKFAVDVFQRANNYVLSLFKFTTSPIEQPPALQTAFDIIETSWCGYFEQDDAKFLFAIHNTLCLLAQPSSNYVVEDFVSIMNKLIENNTASPATQRDTDASSISVVKEREVHKDQPKKGNYAQRVAGLMLSLLGMTVIAGFTGAYVMGFLLSVPATVVGMAIGIGITASGYGFFRAGQGSGFAKDASADKIPLSAMGMVS
jgi:hypothetical protein